MDNEEALLIAIASMAEVIKKRNAEFSKLEDINEELRYELAMLKTQLDQRTHLNNTGEPSPTASH